MFCFCHCGDLDLSYKAAKRVKAEVDTTHLHDNILDLILSPSDQDTISDVKICDFISAHALIK